jgi:hypothetical protein
MGEPMRKDQFTTDDQLTTADMAARSTASRSTQEEHEVERPQLVRSEGAGYRGDTPNAPTDRAVSTSTALFSEGDIGDLRGRWSNVQTGFVDEPRRAVEEADKLVAAVMQRLAEGFAKERANLEKQWDGGDNVSTEDLRVALQRYRSFFDRLLNA